MKISHCYYCKFAADFTNHCHHFIDQSFDKFSFLLLTAQVLLINLNRQYKFYFKPLFAFRKCIYI